MFEPIDLKSTCRPYAIACWLLTVLCAAPVLCQAVQRWDPQPHLPPFEAFREIDVPYWLSLSVQIAVLATMAAVSWRMHRGALVPKPLQGRVLGWLGAGYMALTLGRITAGLTVPGSAPWLCIWMPALFHIVLAGFLLTVSFYHRREQVSSW